jgi:hypothetical protein
VERSKKNELKYDNNNNNNEKVLIKKNQKSKNKKNLFSPILDPFQVFFFLLFII